MTAEFHLIEQPPVSLELVPPALNSWQEVAAKTHNIIAPANGIDAVALRLAVYAGPRLDTWKGIGAGALAYGLDAVDGRVARATKTDSELGARVDVIGDKLKIAYGLYHIWRNDQAPKLLLAAVGAQNLANAGITMADRVINDKPQVEVSHEGKMSMVFQIGGIGMNVIGTKVSETMPALGKAVKASGTILAVMGLAKYGLPATKHYYQSLKDGFQKPPTKPPKHIEPITSPPRCLP